MITVKIKIWGIVQGVGFRPFIARLAVEHQLKGWVLNQGGSVLLTISGTPEQIQAFIQDIKYKKPEPAEIVYMEREDVEYVPFDTFKIIESHEGDNEIIFIPPDLSICKSCEEELFTPENPRYLHPFISCMECGPRYTIFDKVPYDRDNTSMIDFPMCDYCNTEYTNMTHRRYHAQTISCHDCGPYAIYGDKKEAEAMAAAIKDLKSGGIIAVKGVGGYHLACSPFIEETVENLRKLKGREEKPFAVMFANMEELQKYCIVTPEEAAVLESKEKPIVLLKRLDLENPAAPTLSDSVYRSSRYLGAFLPYTPMQHLIIKEAGPLIMTSANISDEPIIIDEEGIFKLKSPHLTGVLYNKRQIRVGIDDSVVKFTDGNMQFIRRARGYAPLPIYIPGKKSDSDRAVDPLVNKNQILATGGQLKNTFSLAKGKFVYMSQYLGDLEDTQGMDVWKKNIDKMKNLFRIEPNKVCCDLHPNYMTTQYAESLGIPVVKIQHHFAHITSVMAEKNIHDEVIGISFDGTGYGTDGRIWGGEFLICSPSSFKRAGHLKYIPMLGGDTSMKEAWKSAYMYMYQSGAESEIQDDRWPIMKAAILNKINSIESSSMGRLFDAVSAMLDIQQTARYEGEAAIKLENKGAEYYDHKGIIALAPYTYTILPVGDIHQIDVSPCIRQMLEDKKAGRDTGYIAAKFHSTTAAFTADMCQILRERYGINKVALSGGVFQNNILFELTAKMLRSMDFEVHFNRLVPPNDGCISLGQAFAAMNL